MASKIILSSESYGCYSLSQVKRNGKSIFYQLDYDFPSLANIFGWKMAGRKCKHIYTDGTIDCPECGKKASDFIADAVDFLDRNNGKVIIDRYGIFDNF